MKNLAFPRRKRVTESDIGKALSELAGMGCISLYEVDGESYFYFPRWSDHQRIQTKVSKFPAPPTSVIINGDSPSSTVSHGDSPLEARSENTEARSENPNTKRTAFSPPTLADVEAYCKERRNSVDPQRFFDYYSAGGWKDKDGKPVKNWKQKMISVWEKKKEDKHETGQRDYTAAPDGMLLIT